MKGQRRKKIKWTGWSMVLAASLFVLIFSYIPMIQAFILSLQTGNAYSAKSAHPFRRNGAPFRLKLSNAQLVN